MKRTPIKAKIKKCKCGCGETLNSNNHLLGFINIYHKKKWIEETEQGQKYLSKTIKQAQKKVEKEKKAKKEKVKKELTDWKEKLKEKIQLIARLIDNGQPCLARSHMAKQMHGGHVFSVGSSFGFSLNLHNVHRQSAQSNHFQNEDGKFRDGLKNEYGEKYLSFLQRRASIKLHKSNAEYAEKYPLALDIVKRLKAENKVYSLEERISLRNSINLELGIYEEKDCVFPEL